MNRWICTLAAVATALALAAPASAQRSDTFTWRGDVDAGGTVSVRGINGSIEARPGSGRTVRVEAVKKTRDGSPADLDVDVRRSSDGIQICAVYPLENGGTKNACDHGRDGNMRDNTSIDFVIQVPSGVHFEGTTVNGSITTGDLGGDVSVRTVNGGIEVSGAGKVEAHTVNGAIEAATGVTSWDGDLEFETVNGSITIVLPAGVNARVSAKTVNGGIETDFPLTVQGRWGPRKIEGTIGRGGGTLQLETVNGAIRLRRS